MGNRIKFKLGPSLQILCIDEKPQLKRLGILKESAFFIF